MCPASTSQRTGVAHRLGQGPSTDPEVVDRCRVVNAGVGRNESGSLVGGRGPLDIGRPASEAAFAATAQRRCARTWATESVSYAGQGLPRSDDPPCHVEVERCAADADVREAPFSEVLAASQVLQSPRAARASFESRGGASERLAHRAASAEASR